MMCPEFLEKVYLALHRRVYARRKENAVRFPKRVVSIGNLSMGGTGKTPLVEYLARRLAHMKPMVVLRGYGAKGQGLVSDGETILSTCRESGDEAMLLARTKGLRVAAGRDRAKLIEAHSAGSHLILLDDAFQNPSVARDLEVVLIDTSLPLSRLRVAPCGKFRERLDALERADAVLLTRTGPHTPEWKQAIEAVRPDGLPVFESSHVFAGLENLTLFTKRETRATGLPARAGAFCGIGNPDAFFGMLRSAGIEIVDTRAFRDHHPFRAKDLELPNGIPWITTAKDAVRIAELNLPEARAQAIWIARMELSITLGERLVTLVAGQEGNA